MKSTTSTGRESTAFAAILSGRFCKQKNIMPFEKLCRNLAAPMICGAVKAEKQAARERPLPDYQKAGAFSHGLPGDNKFIHQRRQAMAQKSS